MHRFRAASFFLLKGDIKNYFLSEDLNTEAFI